MSYTSETALFLDFDTIPLYAEGANPEVSLTEQNVAVEEAVFNNGWKMETDSYAEFTKLNNVYNEFSLSFWLKSVNPGIASDGSALRMPVMTQGGFTIVGDDVNLADTSSFCIFEETLENGNNQLVLAMMNTSNFISYHTSPEYSVGEFHHFWISWFGASQILKLYIDQVEVSFTSSSSIPYFLGTGVFTFKLNYNCIGKVSTNLRNAGTIDALTILDNYYNDQDLIDRITKYGGIYITNNDYLLFEEIYQGWLFDDSGTVEITGISNSRGQMYVAKSNGQLLKGSKKIWDSRINFGYNKELQRLTVFSRENTSPTIVNGVLNINNEIVRI